MSIVLKTSDIVTAFGAKKRIRTMNYRGSVMESVIALDGSMFTFGDGDSNLIALMPIPYSASIHDILIGNNLVLTAGAGSIGIYGINNDNPNDLTEIDKSILKSTASFVGVANSFATIMSPSVADKTIYQLLCDEQGVPKTAFKPYHQSKYGMLTFSVTTKASANATTENLVKVLIKYVEGAPSEGPLTELTINSRATPIA
jgi:hypothetical protein